MKYVRANLGLPPQKMYFLWGDVPLDLDDWIQPLDTWRIALYGHEGVAHLNSRPIMFTPGTGALFSPGMHCGHAKVGSGTKVAMALFNLPSENIRPVALPTFFPVSNEFFVGLESAGERGIDGSEPGRALVWHLLWSISKPVTVIRDQSAIYDAEDFIRSNLSSHLTVSGLSRQLDVAQRTLLTWFQAEHGTTIQGYIRQVRAREACRLLVNSNLSVKAIASKVGVPDLHQFNKLVRNHVGLSPRSYRKRAG